MKFVRTKFTLMLVGYTREERTEITGAKSPVIAFFNQTSNPNYLKNASMFQEEHQFLNHCLTYYSKISYNKLI